ncbi:hypothetical protein D9M68_304210 [compost metagenome]
MPLSVMLLSTLIGGIGRMDPVGMWSTPIGGIPPDGSIGPSDGSSSVCEQPEAPSRVMTPSPESTARRETMYPDSGMGAPEDSF